MTSRQTVSSPAGARALSSARPRLGTREEVAEYLGVPVATLAQWAYKKVGPPYKLIGRHARYEWNAVDAWIDAQQTGGAA